MQGGLSDKQPQPAWPTAFQVGQENDVITGRIYYRIHPSVSACRQQSMIEILNPLLAIMARSEGSYLVRARSYSAGGSDLA